MKIEYLHKLGGNVHAGPTGTVYTFAEDDQGRRVAEVEYLADQERFLALTDGRGQPLFVALDKPKSTNSRPAVAKPAPTLDSEAP